jgi:Rieske Fe-S protein
VDRAQLDRIRADTPVTRRDYLRILVTVSAGLAAGAAGVAVGLFRRHGSGTAAPAKVADRLEPGQAVAFRYPGTDDRALAIRLPDGRLVGWSAVCTHLACAVLWREEDNQLECPCHDGVFDPATGEVVAGPPPAQGGAARGRQRHLGRGDRLVTSLTTAEAAGGFLSHSWVGCETGQSSPEDVAGRVLVGVEGVPAGSTAVRGAPGVHVDHHTSRLFRFGAQDRHELEPTAPRRRRRFFSAARRLVVPGGRRCTASGRSKPEFVGPPRTDSPWYPSPNSPSLQRPEAK